MMLKTKTNTSIHELLFRFVLQFSLQLQYFSKGRLVLSNKKHMKSVDPYFFTAIVRPTTSPYLDDSTALEQYSFLTTFSLLEWKYKLQNNVIFFLIHWLKTFPHPCWTKLKLSPIKKGVLYFAILFFSLWKAWPQLNVIWFTWVDSKSKISNGVTFFL